MEIFEPKLLTFRGDFRQQPDGCIPKIDLVTTRLPEDRTAYLEYGITENPKILSLVKIITGRVGKSRLKGARFMSGDEAGLEWRVGRDKIRKSDEWASKSHIVVAPPNWMDYIDKFGQRVSTTTRYMNKLRTGRYDLLEKDKEFRYGDIDEWIEYLEHSASYLKSIRNGKTWSELALDIP